MCKVFYLYTTEKEHLAKCSATSEGRTKDLWEFYRIWNHKLTDWAKLNRSLEEEGLSWTICVVAVRKR
jgi:hypothetical protein